MSSTSSTRGPARETRLLLLTLGVSVAMLFVLARFRFPERPISDLAAPQPLTRLARATTFEDLSATLGDLLRRAADAQVPLRVGDADGNTRLVPGLQIRDDLAIVVVAGDQRVTGEATPVVARDEVRGLALVRVPVQATPSLPIQPPNESLEMPGFLVFIDAAPGGPSVRAEFVSRATPQPHPAWDAPLLSLGGIATPRPGALVFTLDGRFVGMVLASDDETLVVPGEALIARADRLTHGESILAANAGLTVQPLSSALAKATKADHGVIIAAINNGSAGSGAGPLRVGDVIQMMDRDEIRSVSDWERVLSHRAPGTTVTLQIARRDGTTQVPLTLMWRDAPLAFGGGANGDRAAGAAKAGKTGAANTGDGNAARSGAAAFGLGLRALTTRNAASDAVNRGRGGASGAGGADGGAGALEVTRVDAGSAAARAGLHVGDRLVALPASQAAGAASARAGDSAANPGAARVRGSAASSASATTAPGPLTIARVDAAFDALADGDALLLSVNRGGQPLLFAVEKAAAEKARVAKP